MLREIKREILIHFWNSEERCSFSQKKSLWCRTLTSIYYIVSYSLIILSNLVRFQKLETFNTFLLTISKQRLTSSVFMRKLAPIFPLIWSNSSFLILFHIHMLVLFKLIDLFTTTMQLHLVPGIQLHRSTTTKIHLITALTNLKPWLLMVNISSLVELNRRWQKFPSHSNSYL